MNTQLDELQWKSPEWIQTFGLRTDNVLDYFAESPFFDKTSNNQVIRMQQQFDVQQQQQQQQQQQIMMANGLSNENNAVPFNEYPSNRQYILQNYPVHYSLEKELRKLTKGVEYVLCYVREPDLWIIRKQEKIDTAQWKTLSDYYIIGANVYMSPQLGKVVGSRMLSTNYHLSNALSKLAQLTNGFTPSQGFRFVDVAGSSSSGNTPTSAGNNNFGGSSGIPSSAPATTHMGTIATPSFGKTPSTASLNTGAGLNTLDTGITTNVGSTPGLGNKEVLSAEVADKLLLTSIKSEPTYL
ncbi:hypothetical protein ACO0QE_000534 [Hanseniaspora vineae]